ncbi:MAG TPA: penicillin-binding protein 2 [Gaiellaceae bacterium]|nr:penicillin-binding protein 2 [Gaiellaceae bacterium]
MNRQLVRLALVAVLLLVVLVVATTYWQAWAAGGLAARQDNAVELVSQFQVARGLILASDDKTTLAANRKVKHNGQTFYFRRYPQHGLAAQTVGYSTSALSQTGLEESLNDYLTGASTNLSNAIQRTLDRLGGATVYGDNVVLTINAGAQALAQQLLGDRCGAVVAMNPRTGAIYAMASSPTYDPNLIDKPGGYAKVLKITGACGASSALLNRATDGLFTPGSTFKMVTAAAAIDSGALTPASRFNDPGYCVEYGKHVSNAGNPDQRGPEAYGNVTLAQGFQHSINSVFCNVGKQIGAKTILDYAKKFGFYSTPPLETPANQRVPSGLYHDVKGRPVLWFPKDPATAVDPGRLAFGQFNMVATPLQMLLVASTIANGGVLPRPYIVDRVVGHDGSIVERTRPSNLGRAIKPQTAADLTQMMISVVQGGTGTAAQIPGIQVAGKTGTAETGINNVYTAWFVCFAPANDPKVAVAVVLEKQLNGFGGAVSAPIAKQILEKLLHG